MLTWVVMDLHLALQGDVIYDIPEFLVATFPQIPKEKVFLIVDGKKEPAFG